MLHPIFERIVKELTRVCSPENVDYFATCPDHGEGCMATLCRDCNTYFDCDRT